MRTFDLHERSQAASIFLSADTVRTFSSQSISRCVDIGYESPSGCRPQLSEAMHPCHQAVHAPSAPASPCASQRQLPEITPAPSRYTRKPMSQKVMRSAHPRGGRLRCYPKRQIVGDNVREGSHAEQQPHDVQKKDVI